MIVCDSCRKELTNEDGRVVVSLKYVPNNWLKAITARDDIILCTDCDKSVMSFIRNRAPRMNR